MLSPSSVEHRSSALQPKHTDPSAKSADRPGKGSEENGKVVPQKGPGCDSNTAWCPPIRADREHRGQHRRAIADTAPRVTMPTVARPSWAGRGVHVTQAYG